jgi:hypothetical protein
LACDFFKNATKPTPLEDLFLERRGMETRSARRHKVD